MVGSTVRFISSRPYTLIAVVFFAVMLVPLLRKKQDWQTVYLPAAERLASGEDIYVPGSGFVYPPVNAWLALPFQSMPRLFERFLWCALNATALLVLILGAWKLSGGGWLEGATAGPKREHVIFWLGLVCGLPSCIDAITNEQTDLIIAALLILGCIALVGGRDIQSALWFGIAAGIKCTPLLWAPYLLWHKRWFAATAVVLVAGGINLLPDLTHRPNDSFPRLADWGSRFLKPMATEECDFGTWACGVGGNQSMAGVTQRWLIYDPVLVDNELLATQSPSRWSSQSLKGVSFAGMFVLVGIALACTWRTAAASPGSVPAPLVIQFGMVMILMLLFSPHSSKPHFCTLVLPGFCVARAALNRGDKTLLVTFLVAVACVMTTNQDLVGSWIFGWAKWHGAIAWAALLLFGMSCRILLRRDVLAVAPANPQPLAPTPIRQAA